MRAAQAKVIAEIASVLENAPGYEGCEIYGVSYKDGDATLGLRGCVGDVALRIEADGSIRDVFRRSISLREALVQISFGVEAPTPA